MNPALARQLDSQLPYTEAEALWAARSEMARSVEDVLARRTRALFLNARAALRMAPRVATILAEELLSGIKLGNGFSGRDVPKNCGGLYCELTRMRALIIANGNRKNEAAGLRSLKGLLMSAKCFCANECKLPAQARPCIRVGGQDARVGMGE